MLKATYRYKISDLNLAGNHIAGLMGYNAKDTPEPVSDLILECIELADSVCDIRAEYYIFDNIILDLPSGTLTIGGTSFMTRKIILSQLSGADQAALFLCTAGPAIGELSRKYMSDNDLLKGYVLDVIGSEVVEEAVSKLQKELEMNTASSGRNITNRFSPGYCGWDLQEQRKLFGLIPDNFCNISLSESALMIPIKSVSGLIGIGKEAIYMPYTCDMCDSINCIYRGKR